MKKTAAWTDAHQGAAVNKRFKKLKKDLNQHGVMVGGHKRVSFPKHHFSHDDLTKHLGMTKVKIAVPEAGQKTFTTYRHHDHNYHIHDHDTHWTMHRDDHPSATMVMKKLKMQREAEKARAKMEHAAGRAGSKIRSKARSAAGSVRHGAQMAGALVGGAPHVITEGVPGAYYYAKGRVAGAKSTADTVWRAQGGRMRKKYKGWAKSRKQEKPVESSKTAGIEWGMEKAALMSTGGGITGMGNSLVSSMPGIGNSVGGMTAGANKIKGLTSRLMGPKNKAPNMGSAGIPTQRGQKQPMPQTNQQPTVQAPILKTGGEKVAVTLAEYGLYSGLAGAGAGARSAGRGRRGRGAALGALGGVAGAIPGIAGAEHLSENNFGRLAAAPALGGPLVGGHLAGRLARKKKKKSEKTAATLIDVGMAGGALGAGIGGVRGYRKAKKKGKSGVAGAMKGGIGGGGLGLLAGTGGGLGLAYGTHELKNKVRDLGKKK
jgi:hypothetical protein